MFLELGYRFYQKWNFIKKNEHLPILNLAWHIPKAVRNNLSNNKYFGEVIDIL